MHQKNIITAGEPLAPGRKVLIMLHGRGGTAENILLLADELHVADFTLMAPQAAGNSWYPYSFLSPTEQNEPWLSSALTLLTEVVDDLLQKGIAPGEVYFAGFSQGACLALEFVARNAKKYGGVAAFTGGLIGDKILTENYNGDFEGTPFFIGSSDPDPHVPAERVYASTKILKSMHASVTEKLYKNMGHTINSDEIVLVNQLLFGSAN